MIVVRVTLSIAMSAVVITKAMQYCHYCRAYLTLSKAIMKVAQGSRKRIPRPQDPKPTYSVPKPRTRPDLPCTASPRLSACKLSTPNSLSKRSKFPAPKPDTHEYVTSTSPGRDSFAKPACHLHGGVEVQGGTSSSQLHEVEGLGRKKEGPPLFYGSQIQFRKAPGPKVPKGALGGWRV